MVKEVDTNYIPGYYPYMITKRIALTTLKINDRTRAFPVVMPADQRVRPSTFNVVIGLPTKIDDPRLSRY